MRQLLCWRRWRWLPAIALSLFLHDAKAQTATYRGSETIVYELPSASSRKVGVLKPGDRVQFLQRQEPWLRLRIAGGVTGWVRPMKADQSGAAAGNAKKGKSESRRDLQADQAPKGSISLHLGLFGGDFSYAGKFAYRSWPRVHFEGSFQFVADKVVSIYNMDANFKFIWRETAKYDAWLSTGAGVLTNVPVKAAGARSISNMAVNYGIGIQRPLQARKNVRLDVRHVWVISNSNRLSHFFELLIGLQFDLG